MPVTASQFCRFRAAALLLCLLLSGRTMPAHAQTDAPPAGRPADSPAYNLSTAFINVDVQQTQAPSAGGGTTIFLSPLYAFAGPVRLSLAGLPSGVSAVFSPSVVTIKTGRASSRLEFTVSRRTRPGFYPIDLRAVSGVVAKSAPINLTIAPPAHAADAVTEDVDAVEIEQGRSDTVTLRLNPSGGSQGSVHLRLWDDPAHLILSHSEFGIQAAFSLSALSSGHRTSTLTFRVGSEVPEGTYHLLITAAFKAGTQTLIQTLIQTLFVPPSERHVGFGMAVPPPSSTSPPPPYPLAASVSDMIEYDFDDSPPPPTKAGTKHSGKRRKSCSLLRSRRNG